MAEAVPAAAGGPAAGSRRREPLPTVRPSRHKRSLALYVRSACRPGAAGRRVARTADATTKLGLPRKTLESRIKVLGVEQARCRRLSRI